MEELSMCLLGLSVLFPVSYMKSFRKKEWVANFDAEESKIMEDYDNQGRIIYVYTLLGAILRCIGLAGIVNTVLIVTADFVWGKIIEMMTMGFIWLFFGSEFGFSAFIGVAVGIWYFWNLRDRIRTWV